MDPHPSQQHAGLHHAVWQPQQEVTRPKARFKPTLPVAQEALGGWGSKIGANISWSAASPDQTEKRLMVSVPGKWHKWPTWGWRRRRRGQPRSRFRRRHWRSSKRRSCPEFAWRTYCPSRKGCWRNRQSGINFGFSSLQQRLMIWRQHRVHVKNGPSSATFSFIFGFFKQTLQILEQIDVKNLHSVSGTRIRNHDLLIMSLLL